jgi:hypothetical protein
MATGYLKTQLENPDGAAPRKLAVQEKVFRMAAVKKKYSGIKVENELEPSDQLIDRFHQMTEENRLSWVPWNECTARCHEVVGQKKQAVIEESGGVLRISKESTMSVTDTSTDYLLRLALQRRGLAMEIAGIVSYECHEQWVAEMFACRMRDPPPGYGYVTVSAMEASDKALFVKLSDMCRERIASDGTTKPVELAFPSAMAHPSVTFRLLPLPTGSSSSTGTAKNTEDGKAAGKTKSQKWKAKLAAKALVTKGKGKGKGKEKGKGALPAALIGLHSKDADGNRLCFNFNLPGGCEYEAGACPRGKHKCMKPGCYLPHSQLEHAEHAGA